MLCKKPYMIGSMPCPCGRCLPCLINRRRIWTGRMMLESQKHADSSFVTLTYGPDRVPRDGSLVPQHARDFLKRLRYFSGFQKLRYFLVGEYGDVSQRPHYHSAIFGLSPLLGGGTDGVSGIVQEAWKQGFTYVGTLTPQSAAYIAGYVTKKMTGRDDERLEGRYPEFARMSLRPGIGALAVGDIAKPLATEVGLDYVGQNCDVPATFRSGGKLYPLGRYLRGKIRSELGLDSKLICQDLSKKAVQEMQRLYQEDVAVAQASSRNVQEYRLDRLKQKCLNMTKKFDIFASRRYL